MKTQKFLLLLIVLLGAQLGYGADTYQHWISWFQKADNTVTEIKHDVTIAEMADITAALYGGKVSPGKLHQLSSGIIYKVPQPKLYLEYIEKCVRAARPSATTPQLVVDAILSADRVQWGNDISVLTKNYYYSTVHSKVKYIDNFTGNTGIWVLVIDGTPTIKCDCGNPLERIGEIIIQEEKTPPPPPAQEFKEPKKDDWVFEMPKNREVKLIDLNIPPPVVKKDHKLLWFAAGVLVTSAALYLATRDRGGPAPAPSYPADEGGPAGAPSYPANTGGGPNGSPTYGFNPNPTPNNFTGNTRLSLKMNFDDVSGMTGTKVNFAPKRSYGLGVVFNF